MSVSSDIPSRAKRFKIYKNGDPKFLGKDFVLNRRQIRNWESFLQQVTKDTRSVDAVRSIRTPVGGTKIEGLDQLQDSCNYVAVGNDRFKKLGYASLDESFPRRAALPSKNVNVKPVEHSRIQVSGRIRKIPTDILAIQVYANGKELEPARRVSLTRPMLQSWDSIFRQVTEKVNLNSGATRRLCTLDGQTVTNPASLQNGQFYVAVGADIGGYKNLNYGAQRPAFNFSPKQEKKRLSPLYIPRRGRKHFSGSQQSGTTTLDSSITSTGSSVKGPKSNASSFSVNRTSKKTPKPPVHKGVTKKVTEEDTVFHAKPVKYKRSSEKQRPVDYDRDEGGIFKAQENNEETRDAEEIEDTKDTRVDLPIDQTEAEEIGEDINSDQPHGTYPERRKGIEEPDHLSPIEPVFSTQETAQDSPEPVHSISPTRNDPSSPKIHSSGPGSTRDARSSLETPRPLNEAPESPTPRTTALSPAPESIRDTKSPLETARATSKPNSRRSTPSKEGASASRHSNTPQTSRLMTQQESPPASPNPPPKSAVSEARSYVSRNEDGERQRTPAAPDQPTRNPSARSSSPPQNVSSTEQVQQSPTPRDAKSTDNRESPRQDRSPTATPRSEGWRRSPGGSRMSSPKPDTTNEPSS